MKTVHPGNNPGEKVRRVVFWNWQEISPIGAYPCCLKPPSYFEAKTPMYPWGFYLVGDECEWGWISSPEF